MSDFDAALQSGYQTGDEVVVTSTIIADVQTFLSAVRSQRISTIALSRGGIFRVVEVIPSSGACVLGLSEIFGEYNTVEISLHDNVLIYCSKADVRKLKLVQRGRQQDANNDSSQQGDTGEEEEETVPLTLMGSASYNDIVSNLSELRLPTDIAKEIATFLVVKPLSTEEISVAGASSTRGDFPLDSVLGNKYGTWWISAEGSMENGVGEEYLEFRLSADGMPRRVTYVGLNIPPLPQGPLSVRRFRIDWRVDGQRWNTGGDEHIMETTDVAGMQGFQLGQPIDAARVRLVCLNNAIAAEQQGRSYDCVGFFHIRWK